MRSAPVEHPHFLDARATILVIVAAFGFTVKWWQGHDLTVLLVTYETWPEEPWRLLTSCLLHANLLHLLFNLLWMWRFGLILEPIFGLVATIAIYVLLGMGSSAAQWAVSGGGVGLSGIGYGMFGLLFALDRWHPNFRGVMDRRTAELFALWFVLCVVVTYMDILPIGNTAHGAGAVLGALLGASLSPFPHRRRLGRIGLIATVALVTVCVTVGRPYVNRSEQRTWELGYEGYEALMRRDDAAAARYLEDAVERDGERADLWHNLAIAYHRLDRGREADEAERRAERLEATSHVPSRRQPPLFERLDALLREDEE